MAVKYAVATGNWSNTATWNGGTLPSEGDSVHANGYTVTIDQDIEVERISTEANSPAVAGGGFTLSSIPGGGRVLACNIYASTTTCLTVSAATGNVTGVINVFGGTGTNTRGIDFGATAVSVTCSGTITGGTTSSGHGVYGTGMFSITCHTVTARTNHFSVGISATGAARITAVNAIAPNGGSGTMGIQTSGPAIINVTNVYGPNAVGTGNGINAGGNVAVSITVTNVYAGITGYGMIVSCVPGVVDILGEVWATDNFNGVQSQASTLRVRGPLYNASSNRAAIYATCFQMHASPAQTSWTVYDDSSGALGGDPMVLSNYTSESPAPENVRKDVAYGPLNALVGIAAIPTAEQVASGVEVDQTVGTAALKLTDVAAVTGAQISAAVGG